MCLSLGLQFRAFINFQRLRTAGLIQPTQHTEEKNYRVFGKEGRDQMSSSSKKGAELELGIRRLRLLVRSWLCDFGLVASTL